MTTSTTTDTLDSLREQLARNTDQWLAAYQVLAITPRDSDECKRVEALIADINAECRSITNRIGALHRA